MALYSQTIKNLISGISQQPPILRYPEQLHEQLNGMSTEVGGIQKRPPTIHVKHLGNLNTNKDSLIHIINRDKTEQYVTAFTGNGLKVWDMKGNEKVVKIDNPSSSQYITTDQPLKNLKIITVADYSFIVNTTVVPKIKTDVTTPNYWAGQGLLINVKSGQYGRTYSIWIRTTTGQTDYVTIMTPDGSDKSHTALIDTNYIANQLATQFANTGRYDVGQGEGWLYVVPKAGYGVMADVVVKDGFNNTAMFAFLHNTQKFTNLPITAPANFCVKVSGDPSSADNGYYIRYDYNEKVWKECAEPNIPSAFNPATMPHALVRQADGTFLLKALEWEQRKTGDEDSNPEPSFVDTCINDVFFFRNRLGFIAGENVILSKVGEFFDFWMASATDVLDTDCIDLAVSHNKVSILKHAVPFNEELLLFSDQTQFVLKAEGVMTPKTAILDQTTEFECLSTVKPVGAGRNLYFPSERALFTSLKEYYALQDVTDVKNAQDITSHVPSYIPNGVYDIIASTTENIIMILTKGEKNSVYVYKYLFVEEQRVQSSWSKWDLGEDCEILGGDFVNSTFYLIVKRGDADIFLEKMLFTYNTKDFAADKEPYRVFLDRKALTPVIPANAYSTIYNTTTIQLKDAYGYQNFGLNKIFGVVSIDGKFQTVTPDAEGQFELEGDYTGQQLVVGVLYTWLIKFSEIMIKKDDGRGGIAADTEGRLQVKHFWVNYVDSGVFKAIVSHLNKGTYEYTMSARILGSGENKLGVLPFETGIFKFPVQSLSTNCEIVLISEAPTPLAIIGAGWDGNYIRRTQRI